MSKTNIKKLFANLELHYSIKLWRTKVIKVHIPNNADDGHYRTENKAIVYFQKGQKKIIALPNHDHAQQLFRSPFKSKQTGEYTLNRYIEVKLFY